MEGRIKKLAFDEVGSYDQALDFGFEFDPSVLPGAVSEVTKWLARCA